jgi:diguanylate cyclase (GGDEF)-like protein
MMWRQREPVRAIGQRPAAADGARDEGANDLGVTGPRPLPARPGSSPNVTTGRSVAGAAGRGELVAMARLAWALQRTVGLLRHVYAGLGRPAGELTEIEAALAQARTPDEYLELAKRIAGITAPSDVTPVQGAALLVTFRRALATVARSVLAEGVATELEQLSKRYDQDGETDPGPLLQALTHLAEAVARSRESSDVLHDALAHVQTGIRKIADEEESAQSRIRQSRERIASVTEVRELDVVKKELLEETARLEVVLAERRASLEALEKQSKSARRRAARLIAALADATTAAATDVLTGLGNRRALERAVEVRATEGDSVGVLVLDIDHFKRVNDTHGHGVGDRILVHVAEMLQLELRGDDQGFRIGGEEFVVLLSDCDASGALRTAERVRARIEKSPATVLGKAIHVTTSIGVGMWDAAEPFERVVEAADAALYLAKRSGRNRCVAVGAAPRKEGESC